MIDKTNEQIEQELTKYYGQGFNDDQIVEIREGLERGLNVDFYAKKDFSAKQMRDLWQQLNAEKDKYDQQEKEAQAMMAKAEKINEDLKIAANKQHRRESAIIAIVLAFVSMAFAIIRIISIINR